MHGLAATDGLRRDALALAGNLLAHADVADTARMVAVLLSSRVEVGDASLYLRHYARSQGYDIPAYEFAGCGEMKRFLADQGVRDAPGWYARIGVPREEAGALWGRTLVAARNGNGRRIAMVLHGRYHGESTGTASERARSAPGALGEGFTALAESDLIERLGGEPRVGGGGMRPLVPDDALDRILARIIAFELHGETGGLPMF